MFTGLIEQIGVLTSVDQIDGGTTFTLGHGAWRRPLEKGESVAVNGVCFTVTGFSAVSFTCDALDETLSRTTLGSIREGARVNLERALRVGDSLGGHFVSGHVDGVARLLAIRDAGRDKILRYECDPELLRGMVMKGSVACDGTSLTISALSGSWFEVNVIPFTWGHTVLSGLTVGASSNLETDMLGKFVLRSLPGSSTTRGLVFDDLRNAGFMG